MKFLSSKERESGVYSGVMAETIVPDPAMLFQLAGQNGDSIENAGIMTNSFCRIVKPDSKMSAGFLCERRNPSSESCDCLNDGTCGTCKVGVDLTPSPDVWATPCLSSVGCASQIPCA